MDQGNQAALEVMPQMGLLGFTFKKLMDVIQHQSGTIADQKEGIKEQAKIIEGKDRQLQEKSKRIEELKEEINRLKKHKSKPKLRSSALTRNNKGEGGKKKRGKQTKPKRKADHTEIIKAEDIPAGSRFKGYRPYIVQTLEIKVKKLRINWSVGNSLMGVIDWLNCQGN